jgi:hypothetical protein
MLPPASPRPEGGDNMVVRNVSILRNVYTVSRAKDHALNLHRHENLTSLKDSVTLRRVRKEWKAQARVCNGYTEATSP